MGDNSRDGSSRESMLKDSRECPCCRFLTDPDANHYAVTLTALFRQGSGREVVLSPAAQRKTPPGIPVGAHFYGEYRYNPDGTRISKRAPVVPSPVSRIEMPVTSRISMAKNRDRYSG